MENICCASSTSIPVFEASGRMKFTKTPIADAVLIEPEVFGDARGFFMETWQQEKFKAAGIEAAFVQDNHSHSNRWSLRGLHVQVRHTQGKLVRVAAGGVFDVIVDLRRRSPSFGASWSVELSAENRRMLWVPPGLAHGILITSESADFLYKCTDFYRPADERTLAWDDAALAIPWPLPPGVAPQLSAKEARGATFAEIEKCASEYWCSAAVGRSQMRSSRRSPDNIALWR
jgi:dTDP-4-dehydrorhamnose 3,5-epimerase